MTIRIDPEVMNQRAGQYRAEAQNIGHVMSTMDGLLRTLQMEWEGEASRTYEDRYYADVRPHLQRSQQLIEEIALSLDRTAQQMREQDLAMASMIKR